MERSNKEILESFVPPDSETVRKALEEADRKIKKFCDEQDRLRHIEGSKSGMI